MPQLSTFHLGNELFAIDILITKEIGKIMEITKVAGSHDFVLGLMNLRGQVVTIIDPSLFLDQKSRIPLDMRKLIILKTENEVNELRRNDITVSTILSKDPMAIVVDQISDVLDVEQEQILPVPSNITGNKRELVTGVVQLDKQLVIILAMEKLIKLCSEIGRKNLA